ncbi:Crp/Fnr family transcriptional regulator [Alicyclobacillus mali]|uniref:Crp/Fnr family transcriptional regulator n=2 Tax=Alicyclobacillus mali (ex Roth et al. 2021) TaxID=1123961 RepID=A0ABS0F2Z0_9BACL|nr:Crp/Fnr family transcriptional regulator [Alicyclobacillus mali (ex Roth et al. 2021)]MBF8377648.1 Crp/Fnr family transcriptional regulator [Alicyclobacillus mali (ex Roth et al. 2021)]MCL6487816.1 Crp/Fnr family transcriptional regulator [Alicyclobacillus mali (ex Roth et al. 2021)]
MHLADTPLFRSIPLSDRDRDRLNRCPCKYLHRGRVLYYEGEDRHEMYVVKSGTLRIFTQKDHRILTLGFQYPGQCIGEAEAIYQEMKRTASVMAASDAVLWVVQTNILLELLYVYPKLWHCLFAVVVERLTQADRKIRYLAFCSSTERIANYLVDLHSNASSSDPEARGLNVTQQEIAEALGIHRESVSRALQELEQMGLIRVRRNQISLLNIPHLTKLADNAYSSEFDRKWHPIYRDTTQSQQSF